MARSKRRRPADARRGGHRHWPHPHPPARNQNELLCRPDPGWCWLLPGSHRADDCEGGILGFVMRCAVYRMLCYNACWFTTLERRAAPSLLAISKETSVALDKEDKTGIITD